MGILSRPQHRLRDVVDIQEDVLGLDVQIHNAVPACSHASSGMAVPTNKGDLCQNFEAVPKMHVSANNPLIRYHDNIPYQMNGSGMSWLDAL